VPQIRSKSGNQRLRNTKTFILLTFSWLLLRLFPNKACCAMTLKLSFTDCKKHFNNRRHPDSVLHLEAFLFSSGFWKNRHRVGKFSTRLPFSLRTLFCLFQTYTHILGILLMNSCNTDIFSCLATTIICSLSALNTQVIYAGYAKVAPGKLQTTQAKLTISPRTGEAKFHWVMEKIHLVAVHWICYHS